MDLDLRYTGSSTQRLPKLKTLMKVALMQKSTAKSIAWFVVVLILFGILAGLLVKYDGKIITFPRFKNSN